MGRAYEGLGETAKAVQWYNRAVEKDAQRRATLGWRTIELALKDRSIAGEDLLAKLQVFMETQEIDADLYGRALDRAVDMLLALKRPDRAENLIAQLRLSVSSHSDAATCTQHLEFQQARIWAARGWTEQADNHLIQLIPELPATAALYSRACLLRGQLIRQDNPMEAQKLFREVTAHSPRTPLAIAASEGLARAFADVHSYDKALEQYQAALDGLLDQGDNPYVNLAELRGAIMANQQLLMEAKKFKEALGFAQAEQRLFKVNNQTAESAAPRAARPRPSP